MPKRLNLQEYAGLKTEMSTRVQIMNTQENTAIAMAVVFFAASFTLSVAADNAILDFMSLALLYVPLLLLLPIANKSGENLYQIEVLSCYIMVFYEYASLSGKDNTEEELFYWEFGNSLTSKIRKNGRLFSFFINSGYFIIGLITLAVYACKGIYLLSVKKDIAEQILYAAIILFTLTVVLAVILTITIYSWSSVKKNMQDRETEILHIFAKQAIALGIIQNADINQIIAEITLYGCSNISTKNRNGNLKDNEKETTTDTIPTQ